VSTFLRNAEWHRRNSQIAGCGSSNPWADEAKVNSVIVRQARRRFGGWQDRPRGARQGMAIAHRRPMTRSVPAERQSEVLDVQLLDVFAQVEALLRLGREVQREALRVRGLPVPVSPSQRKAAGRVICKHLEDMTTECRTLGEVLSELHATASELDQLLQRDGEEQFRS
jgi:hypothetical protein